MKTQTSMIDWPAFIKAVRKQGGGFDTIEELVDFADEARVWTKRLKTNGLREFKKSIIRREMRKNHVDEDGNRVEYVNVIRLDQKGHRKQGYKELGLFDLDDYVYVINDRKKRVQECEEELRRFCRLAVSFHGKKQVQMRIEFDLDLDDPNDAAGPLNTDPSNN